MKNDGEMMAVGLGSNKDGAVVLTPPKLMEVDSVFGSLVGEESTQKMIRKKFVADYFDQIIKYVRERFGECPLGIRAVMCSVEPEKMATVASGEVDAKISSIKEIFEHGGELRGLKTNITRLNEVEGEDLDMSKKYLEFSVDTCLTGEMDGSLLPAILVYDLRRLAKGNGSYEIVFENQKDKQDSLLGIYVLNISQLRELVENIGVK